MSVQERIQSNIARLTEGKYPAPYPPEWLVVQPMRGSEIAYPSSISGFVWRAVYEIDKWLEQEASSGLEDTLVRWKASLVETQSAQNAILSILHKEVLAHDDVRVLGLFHGATPGFMSLWHKEESSVYRDKLEPVRANGYAANRPVEVRISSMLSEKNISARLIAIFDDVWDSGHEAAAVLCGIEKLRGKHTDTSIIGRLKNLPDQDSQEAYVLYDEVIHRLQSEGVVLAELFYKNKAFHTHLVGYVQERKNTDEWARVQFEVAQHAIIFDKKDWLMGEGLDTDGEGEILVNLLEHILPDDVKKETHVKVLFHFLKLSKVRLGSFVDGVIAFNGKGKEELLMGAAAKLQIHIEEWQRAGFRWEYMYPAAIDSGAASEVA